MNTASPLQDPDERLLQSLLRQIDLVAEANAPATHVDEETMALFAAGALHGSEREQTIQHLSQCPSCRQSASLLATLDETVPQSESRRKTYLFSIPIIATIVTLAASILVIFGLMFRMPDQGQDRLLAEKKVYDEAKALLAAGEFDKVQEVVNRAADNGVESDRLKSLEAQAARDIPEPIALASLGRLSDFGYGIDGVVIRDPVIASADPRLQHAGEILANAGYDDVSVVLNRGHLHLTLGQVDLALADFQAAARHAPGDPLAWLGLGLAQYMKNEFAAAETSFRHSLELDTKIVAARINLAVSLTEQGKLAEALAIWQALLQTPLAESERNAILQQISELQDALQKK